MINRSVRRAERSSHQENLSACCGVRWPYILFARLSALCIGALLFFLVVVVIAAACVSALYVSRTY